MQNVAILLTVHNRREDTLECLQICYRQIDALKGDGTYAFTVYMVDDGCADGTSDAVRETFPQAHIVRGDGSLYWNRGMRAAWEAAEKDNPDFYLWVNVRTRMEDGAIAILLETSGFLRNKAIVAGTCRDAAGNLTYGGRDKDRRVVVPDSAIPVPCDTFDGHLVLVPAHVYRKVGKLDDRYHHFFGDWDYGVRARKVRIFRVVAPGVPCVCELNRRVPKWRDSSFSLKERLALLNAPDGCPPGELFRYDCRSHNVFYALAHVASVALKLFFPKRRYE